MTQQGKKRSKLKRILLWGSLGLVVLFAGALVFARLFLHGPNLAQLIERKLNERIRGEVRIGSVEWEMGDLYTVVTNDWLPITIRDLELYDDKGILVLKTKYATAKIHVHAALFGAHDVVLKDIRLPRGGYAYIKEVKEPYPLHPYDKYVISILSAFYTELQPSLRAGNSVHPGGVFDLRSFSGENIDVDFEFPRLGITASVRGVNAKGFLYSDRTDPLSIKIYYSVTGTAVSAYGNAFDKYTAHLTNLKMTKLEQLPGKWPADPVAHDFAWAGTGTSVEGAEIDLKGVWKGYFTDVYGGDYDVKVSVKRGGPLAYHQSYDVVDGKDMEMLLWAHGPKLGPMVDVQVQDFDLAIPMRAGEPPLDLHVDHATAKWDLATEAGGLDNTIARGAGGEVHAQADFSMDPFVFDVRLDITRAIEVGRYIPPKIAQAVGSKLRGQLHIDGNKYNQRMDNLDLWLGAARVRGKFFHKKDPGVKIGKITIDNKKPLRVSMGKTDVTSRGWIDMQDDNMSVNVNFNSGDANRWLAQFGAPAVVKTAKGNASVRGDFTAPTATGSLSVTGAPYVDLVTANLHYKNKLVSVNRLSTFNGQVTGAGSISVAGAPRVVGFNVRANKLNLGLAPGMSKMLKGRASGTARVSGPLTSLRGRANVDLTKLEIAGDKYYDTNFAGVMRPDGSMNAKTTLERHAGGKLIVDVTQDRRTKLSGTVDLKSLPVETLALLGGPKVAKAGGIINARDLTIGGTAKGPTLKGLITLDDAWFGKAFLGAGDLKLTPMGDGKVKATGDLFQGSIQVLAIIETAAPYKAEVQLRLRRVELDRFSPKLASRLDARAWVSGEVTLRTQLLKPKGNTTADIRLSELAVVMNNADAFGRPAPLRVRNKTPVVLRFDGKTMALRDPVIFMGPAGSFTISGKGSAEKLAVNINGDFSVALLRPYLREYFDKMAGNVAVNIDIGGKVTDPQVVAALSLKKVLLRPQGQDAEITIPTGKVHLTNTQLSTNVSLYVKDKYSKETSVLKLTGGVSLKNFSPVAWGLIAKGDLSGKLLLVAMPKTFSAASGAAKLDLQLQGLGKQPAISGSLRFGGQKTPIAFNLRGLRREVSLNRGRVTFERNVVELKGVGGFIDVEGKITSANGKIVLKDWKPTSVAVTLAATNIPFRVPRTLSLVVNVPSMSITANLDESIGAPKPGLKIEGSVDVVDGRYTKDVDFLKAVTPGIGGSSGGGGPGLFDDVPLIAKAKLDLTVVVGTFFVRNNIFPRVELAGNVRITGTPAKPRLDGNIRVEEGEFKFPGIQAKFTRTDGKVSFSKRKSFYDETPELNITSEADYRDSSGQNHVITFKLRGPVGNPDKLSWDLYTSTGLTKAQTLILLLGQTPEDLRNTVGDDAVGGNPDQIDSRTTISTEDRLVKDFVGDFLSRSIQNKLVRLTGFDVVHLGIGTSSFSINLEKDLLKDQLKVLIDLERSLRGQNWDVGLEWRLSERLSASGEYQSKNFDDATEDDISQFKLRFIYRWNLIK